MVSSAERKHPDSSVTTVRIPEEEVSELMALACLDGGTMNDQVQNAVGAYVERRLADPELPGKIAAMRQKLQNGEINLL